MQGRQSSCGSKPEILDFEPGSTSGDGGLDQQNFWSGISDLGQTRLPNFMVSSMDSSMRFVNSPNQHNQQGTIFSGWDFGESSSRVVQNEGSLTRNDLKTEHGHSNLLSMNNVNVNLQSDGIEYTNIAPLVSHQLPQELNLNSELEDDDDCQVIEFPHGRCSSRKRKIIEAGSSGIGAPVENNDLSFNLPEQVNPRFRSSRDVRLRINNTLQQCSIASNIVSTENNAGNINALRHNPQFNSLNICPASELDIPNTSLRRNLPSRRRNSSSNSVFSERTGTLFDASNVLPRNISHYPMFVPPSETGSSLQSAPMWGLSDGNVNNIVEPTWIHQSSSHHQHRLSDPVRRSLLSVNDSGSGGQNSNNPLLQELSLPSGSNRWGRHLHSRSRSAMLSERHSNGAPGIAFSVGQLTAANVGRSRLMSEQIRHVLDLVRRGEGLRFEDLLLLEQSSIFFGMDDSHDEHRDMRLDVDNMSYEELLALEERIGSVNIGLSEDIIIKQLKQRRLVGSKIDEAETKPCCICQEEYKDGEDLGTLDCGHDFHGVCIKKWLMQKNMCPICKTTGLNK